jgi:hypothetical protein
MNTTAAAEPATRSERAVPTALPMMQPVLRRGRSYLDREVLPGDENEARLQSLLAQAKEQGLDGVVIFGAAHTPENLIYYANYTPTTFHGTLIARIGTPPTLIAGKGGARDHPYIRTVSWVADIRYAAELGDAIAEITGDWSGPLGVAGLDTSLPHEVRDGVTAALGARITPIDDLVTRQRRIKSARELVVLRRASELARAAAQAAVDAYAAGAGRRSALAAADYAARAGNALDCRVTAGTEAGGVATIAEVDDDRGRLSAVIAVEYLGYWGLAGIDPDTAAAAGPDAGFEQLIGRLRPGMDARDVLGIESSDSYLVNGLGCGLAELPAWGAEPRSVLVEGDVLSIVRLRDDAGLRLAVRTVVITADGAREI